MKFPKNRENLFLVGRVLITGEISSICGAFSELAEADAYAGACQQEWDEKTNGEYPVYFDVLMTTYYG